MPTFDPDADRSGHATPEIPSFGSLRGPRRRSPVDVLVPSEPAPPPPARPTPAPRPPEWSDLLHLGVHVTRAVVAAPLRLVRRLLGG